MGYGLDSWGSVPGWDIFFPPFFLTSRPALGSTQPPIQWVLLGGGFPRGKMLGHVADTHVHVVWGS
jgi:hypothetical protein